MAGQRHGGQLFNAGTSVAANCRAACRSRSRADFIAKLGIVIEEADESELWLDLAMADGMMPKEQAMPLRIEAGELVAIMTASQKTAKANR